MLIMSVLYGSFRGTSNIDVQKFGFVHMTIVQIEYVDTFFCFFLSNVGDLRGEHFQFWTLNAVQILFYLSSMKQRNEEERKIAWFDA